MGTGGYLGPGRADPVQSPGRAVQEADDLLEVVVSNAPGAVHQEHQVGLGRPAHWRERVRTESDRVMLK